MTRYRAGDTIIMVNDRVRHTSGKTTRITTDFIARGIGVDLVENVKFEYINGVCKFDVEGRKYSFRTKKARLADDLRCMLNQSDAALEKYRQRAS